ETDGVVRQPMAWGCSADMLTTAAASPPSAPTPIPPPALRQDLADLQIGRAFPTTQPHHLAVLPTQLAAVEQEFCRRDAALICPPLPERGASAPAFLPRTGRIVSPAAAGPAERKAAQRFADEVRGGRLPILLFNTGMRSGPTAGIIRYLDASTGKWIL